MSLPEVVRVRDHVLVTLPWRRGPVDSWDKPVLVAATRTDGASRRNQPGMVLAALALRRRWGTRAGAIGLSLAVKTLTRTTLSISVWQDVSHLRAFLSSPEHLAIVRRYRGRVQVRSATWSTEAFELREAYAEALVRLGRAEPLKTDGAPLA